MMKTHLLPHYKGKRVIMFYWRFNLLDAMALLAVEKLNVIYSNIFHLFFMLKYSELTFGC